MTAQIHHRNRRRSVRRGSIPHADRATVRIARIVRPFLVGCSIGLLLTGFLESCYQLCGFSPLTCAVALPLSAAFLSLGVVLAVWIRDYLDSRFKRSHSPNRRELEERRQMAGAIACFVGGVAVLVYPQWFEVVGALRQSLWEAVLWSGSATIILNAVVIAAAAVPFGLVGASLVLVTCGKGGKRHLTEWVIAPLIGAGAALVLLGVFGSADMGATVWLRFAAIPLLVGAILSVAVKREAETYQQVTVQDDALEEPELRGFRPTLLRLAGGITIVSAAAAGALWTHVVGVVHVGSFRWSQVGIGGVLFSFAAGVGSVRILDRRRDLMGGCGTTCALGGAVVAISTLVFALVFRQTDDPFRHTIGFAGLWAVCACPAIFGLGRAIGEIRLALIRQAAPLESNDVSFFCALCFCGSMGASSGAWLLLERLGSFVALAAVALTMLACGGVLLIHAPAGIAHLRPIRVASVFAVILMMMVTLPPIRSTWLRPRQKRSDSLAESWWGATARDESGQPRPFMSNESAPLGACEIVHDAVESFEPQRVATLGIMPNCAADSTIPDFDKSAVSPLLSWSQELHDSRDRFDLVVISLLGLPDDLVRRAAADVNPNLLSRLLSADGELIIFMPDGDDFRRARSSMIAAFSHRRAFALSRSSTAVYGLDVMTFARGDVRLPDVSTADGDERSIRSDRHVKSESAFAGPVHPSVP